MFRPNRADAQIPEVALFQETGSRWRDDNVTNADRWRQPSTSALLLFSAATASAVQYKNRASGPGFSLILAVLPWVENF
jgi:hypothetical protein